MTPISALIGLIIYDLGKYMIVMLPEYIHMWTFDLFAHYSLMSQVYVLIKLL